ncbi:nuclear transport factor 2 family protein [Agromyces sp. H66]|uniref:nuclear transport factor 2 family protein n=1 Tax=Agromyces sp. H66 TaxID=2529859 RepID=UPI0010A9C04D|nr:nuclear transport factor 2 family protein [Agromyces sp. H66]
MSHADGFDPYNTETVPPVVARYLSAQGDDERRQEVAEAFTADARVTDEGIDYDGRDRIRAWVDKTGSEYTYTTALIGQRQEGPDQWTVVAHLEGDFPGGVVDLRYRFSLEQDRISRLVIAP